MTKEKDELSKLLDAYRDMILEHTVQRMWSSNIERIDLAKQEELAARDAIVKFVEAHRHRPRHHYSCTCGKCP